MGKLTISRRYNQVPLLWSNPGGFQGSWPYRTYPGAKIRISFQFADFFNALNNIFSVNLCVLCISVLKKSG